jgi:Asp-tRNA(Asn)/Glu-tRNA(Gln) amidotransferase A subunit family amidase
MADEEKKHTVTSEMIATAEKVIGLTFTDAERELMLDGVNEQLGDVEKIRSVSVANEVPSALHFDPRLPRMHFDSLRRKSRFARARAPRVPENLEELAFCSVSELAALLRSRQVTSLELTQMYLERLKRYDPILKCVVTLTEGLAIKQARRADREIAAGNYRGLLHGIPYGLKDLLAVSGYKTTWGAETHQDQIIDMDATVVEKLEEAGAVLLAKLSVGALAWGDVWFGGMTKNPWNTEEGSSGSSAGSASAVAAGLVGFAIGTETLGSIVSPATQCRVTGLRPTFGRVSRYGAMALCWSMDKIGPIARTVEDCAIAFDAIYGPDGHDQDLVDLPFNYDANLNVKKLRVGYVKSAFDKERDNKANDDATLKVLKSIGIKLSPIELPDYPINALGIILQAESAATFDELTRSNRDDLLSRQVKDAWPNVLRHSRLIPAVEYVQANRIRYMAMQAMAALMDSIDVYVCPSFGADNLTLTNLTGQPCVVVPNGVDAKGKSSSISFIGKLYGEAAALSLAKAYQNKTDFHLQHPPLDRS